jgi:hypothetical protein
MRAAAGGRDPALQMVMDSGEQSLHRPGCHFRLIRDDEQRHAGKRVHSFPEAGQQPHPLLVPESISPRPGVHERAIQVKEDGRWQGSWFGTQF